MEDGTVSEKTTEPQTKPPRRCPRIGCTLRRLWGWRLPVKVVQTLFSFAALVCEEIVEDCSSCSGLYIFEFVSCSACLLSLLILCAYCTDLYESLGEDKVRKLNFWAVPVIGVLFLLASVAFSVTCSGSPVEIAAYVLGFLSAFVFAVEFGIELVLRQKQKKQKRTEPPGRPVKTRRTKEKRPLNKKR